MNTNVTGQLGIRASRSGPNDVTIRCRPGQPKFTPLIEACRRLLELAAVPSWDIQHLRSGIRRRVLGELGEPSAEEVVANLNRAAGACDGASITIEAAEHADAATVAVLRRAIEQPGRLDVPIRLLFQDIPAGGPAAELARDLELSRASEAPSSTVMPADTLLTLRAAAHFGQRFQVDEVAKLLRVEPLDVLEGLQRAVDNGEALSDRGNGVLELPADRVIQLRCGLLPSLQQRWTEAMRPMATGSPEDPRTGEPRVAEASGAAELLELAHTHWRRVGDRSNLGEARRAAEDARAALEPSDPPGLFAAVLSTMAGILFDLGEADALSEALELLVDASRRLRDADDPVGAARLLNEQAAVWMRLGDSVRAAHLLQKSQKVFQAASDPANPMARAELAETLHLLARLPFHVSAKPGLEVAALQAALENAGAAAEAYRTLGNHRSLGRVLETMGRLHEHASNHAEAVELLTEAVEIQQHLGDALGLARSAAALADVVAASGDGVRAVHLLEDSIHLNLQVGTPLGLAYNRRGLSRLWSALTSNEAQSALRDAEQSLLNAEQIIGRSTLPPNLPPERPYLHSLG